MRELVLPVGMLPPHLPEVRLESMLRFPIARGGGMRRSFRVVSEES
jgi:hypothetical protein